jgi:hypothetical protein
MGSNPAEGSGFLMALKVHNMTSFRGEVKPSVPCHKILWHVKEPDRYEKTYFVGKIPAISRQVYPASLPHISAGYCQTALVDESGISRTKMGTHKRSELAAMLGMPCGIPPCNSIFVPCQMACSSTQEIYM